MLSSTSSRAVSAALLRSCAPAFRPPPLSSTIPSASASTSAFVPSTTARLLFSSSAALPRVSSLSKLSSANPIRQVRRFGTSPVRRFSPTAVAMGGITVINSPSEFKAAVDSSKAAEGGPDLVVVDFFAEWCGPCKAIAPKMAEYSERYPNVAFYKIDVDQSPEIAAENGVRAMPTFAFFKEGDKVDEVMGASPPQIEAAIKRHAGDGS